MKYPTWKVRGHPTPNDTIWICDECKRGSWCPYNIMGTGNPYICDNICNHSNNKNRRMRRGTKKEQEEAKKCLKEII